ncbi:hypothetical protein BX265_8116 [Streptomyces sp. TLI_235]|nr:hypothetical protein [Streptomyces sp. TLI_235]PBC67507.1 hypothetical protein BX265_8116 [Streptomyces sp. TLI_235]
MPSAAPQREGPLRLPVRRIDGRDTCGALSAIRTRTARCTAGPAPHLHRRSPDLFLYAAASLGVAPADRLVVEDSPELLERI